MHVHRILGLGLLLLTFASQAGAQLASSSLSGTVTGTDGAGLPGVTVTVKNQENGLVRMSVTAENGAYAFSGIQPGVYEITFDLEGFSAVSRRDVELRVGQETRLGAALQLEQIEESITVTDEAPILETTSKEIGGILTTQELHGLPSQNRSFALFAALLPGVITAPFTDSTSGDTIFANGQDDNNNSFHIDGANNDDDIFGASAGAQTRAPIEAIQEFQVLTSQFDAEFGRSTGAILNAVTKSGGNSFHGAAFSYFQRSAWNETDFFVERSGQQSPDSEFDAFGFILGGPIVRDKMHFFVSYEDDTAQTGATGVFNTRPELNYTTTMDSRIKNYLAKVDYQLSVSHHLAGRYLLETSPQRNLIINNGNSVATLAAAREEDDLDNNWIATLDSVLGSAGLNEVRVSFTKEDVTPANPAFNRNGRSFQAQRDQAPAEMRPTILDGGSTIAQPRLNESTQLDDTFSYFVPAWYGEHQVKAGFQLAEREMTFADLSTANGQFNFDTDRPFNASDLSTYPTFFSARVKGGLDMAIPDNRTLGVFLQDDWRPYETLTLTLGLRYDREDITDDDDNYAPRLGFAWDPFGRGRTVVRGGYGRFYDRFQFLFYQNFLQDALAIPQGFIVRVPDAGINQRLFFNLAQANGITTLAGLRDLLVQQLESATLLNTAPTVDNPDRKQAYVDSASLGAEHEVLPGLSIALDFIHNENRNVLLRVDLNPFSQARGGRPNLSIVNGQRVALGSITSYVNAGRSEYDSLQLSLKRRFSGRWGGRLSYTWSRSSGNYGNGGLDTSGFGLASAYFQTRTESGYNFDTGRWIGEPLDLNLDDPRNDGQPVNWLRRHNLVLSGSYQVPRTGWRNARGLTISGIFIYRSGDRTTIITNNLLDNGSRAPAPAGTYSATPPSDISLDGVRFDGRFFGTEQPDFRRLDMALRYDLPLVAGITVALSGEIYNATSEENFVSVGNNILGTAGFLTPSATYSPGGRQYQIGVRLGF